MKPNRQLPRPLRNPADRLIDFVIVRESTEGLLASHGKGIVTDAAGATDTIKITRNVYDALNKSLDQIA